MRVEISFVLVVTLLRVCSAGSLNLESLEMSSAVECHELISKAVTGDRIAGERLLLAHYDLLENRVTLRIPRLLRQELPVEDVLQETFIRAVRCLPRCEAQSQQALAAWLLAIADNQVIDMARAATCQKRGGGWRPIDNGNDARGSPVDAVAGVRDSGVLPPTAAARNEAVAALEAAIEGLPRDERRVVRLRLLDGKSLEETATRIQRSPGAVRGLIHRAKRRLRDLMQSSSRWLDKK